MLLTQEFVGLTPILDHRLRDDVDEGIDDELCVRPKLPPLTS